MSDSIDNKLRWLHCSDFHVGKDNYAQRRLIEKIVEHVEGEVGKGFVPDLVFVTGDIANKGLNAEYNTYRNDFFVPLERALGGADWNGRILMVPGNHDIDRTKRDTFDRDQPAAPGSRYFDPTKEGKAKREILQPRFKSYRQNAPAHVPGDWINGQEGAFAEVIEVRGRRIGVVGINTAWLSKDDQDKERLTPGLPLVESALDTIKGCEVRFVLGHHPLNWLVEDEAERLRGLFGSREVIYLHGHLHKAEARPESGAGNTFLVLQAGAAFQARDDEPWRNGLLWGEIDLAAGEVLLSPRVWNPANYDWPLESERFPEKLRKPGSDWWCYPLPGHAPPQPQAALRPPAKPDEPSAWQAPDGWDVLTPERLDRFRREITPAEAGRFFDGAEPEWAHALCPHLPRRTVVAGLVDRILTYRGQERALVLLLIGPGGEGKSMALRQTVADALAADPNLRVLWRNDETATLDPEQLARLPRDQGPWLVATDAADLIARPLHRGLLALRREGRTDVRVLMTARSSDWRAAEAWKLGWWQHADYHEENLSGVTEEDAEVIAASWAYFEPAANLQTPDSDQEALGRRLYEAARAEAAVDEGALLGGMLVVRKGAGLRDHVRALLDRLGEHRLASGGTLYHAFGYIAAMHAEGFDLLSRPVLAQVLGCDPGNLAKQVIQPLGREAAAGGGSLLLTRHRRIAQAAVEVMRDDLGDDMDTRYVELAAAALTARHRGFHVPELHRWNYELPQHFGASRTDLAIRIAEAVLDADPENAHLAVNLARIYRESDEPAASAQVLAGFTGKIGNSRSFWYEWGTCAGNAEDYSVNAVLAGWSPADQAAASPPDNRNAKLALAGLGVAFRTLHTSYRDRVFVEGRSAAAQLGFRLDLDRRTRGYFENHLADSAEAGVKPTDLAGAFDRLQVALSRAWEVCGERETLAERIPQPKDMGFEGLRRLVGQDP